MRHGPLSDAQYQDRLRTIQKARRRRYEDDVRALMESDWGRRLVYSFAFEKGNLHGSSFAADMKHATAEHTAFREGQRSLARSIVTDVQDVAPERYLDMLSEAVRQRQADLALERHEETESAGDDIE